MSDFSMRAGIPLCFLAAISAQPVNANDLLDISISLEGGYRTDNLDWSIGRAEDSTKLSELSYDDMRIYEIATSISVKVSEGIFSGVYSEFDMSWGTIDSGDSTDKDWENFEDRSQVTNYSYSDVKGDYVQDYSLAIGYEFQIADSEFFIMPLLGYAYSEQNMDIGGGAETLEGIYDEDGNYSHSEEVYKPIPGDAASYDTEWEGPWAGIRLQYGNGDNMFSFRAEYHDYDYGGVGDWKLSDEYKHPKSFTHKADGDGYKLSAKYARRFAPNWDFTARINYTSFESESGKETNFGSDGMTLKQVFLGANWESYTARMGVTYTF